MSTLTVQTLQAPTSGANANKVLIPSGHTLDVSAGTLTPSAGQVVQEVIGQTSSYNSTTSTSFVATNLQATITPKFSNSVINIFVFSSAYWNSASTNADYINGTVYRDSTNIGTSGNLLALYGAYGSSQNYVRPFVFAAQDSPSSTSALVYKMYIKVTNGNNGTVNDDRFENTMVLREIKQ
jgi:hypothetical protein